MTKEQLTERIEKTTTKIQKLTKKIKKWEDAKCEKAFLKADGWLLNMGRDRDYLYKEYIKGCDEEIRRTNRELEDEKIKLDKYQNLYNLEVAKDNEFQNSRVEVIWNFLLVYKEKVKEYIRQNIDVLNRYYEVNSQICDMHNERYSLLKTMTEQEYKDRLFELHEEEEMLQNNIHAYTELCAKRNGYRQPRTIDEDKLEELLLKDCKQRYFELVNEVTQYTGIITDARGLNIKAGELNGIIIGEKGKCRVLTFSACGPVQCFHYRTRVTEIK